MKKKLVKIITPVVALALLGGAGAWYLHHESLYPSTDDAYIHAHIVNIAPHVSGRITQVFVTENQKVNKGDPLFTIDPTTYQIAVDKAQAELEHIQDNIQAAQMSVESAQAKLNQSQAELTNTKMATKRTLTLAKSGFTSKASADNAVKNLKVATSALASAKSLLNQAEKQRGALGPNNADLKSAKAALEQAKLNLSYTKVTAPAAGYIENSSLRQGSMVSAYQQVFALVENQHWWTEANYKETQLLRIHPGQTATVVLDMYPNHTFHGKVVSLSSASGSSFSLLPPENASANWVKVTQRFPVRIELSDDAPAFPLRVGASSTVTINTTR